MTWESFRWICPTPHPRFRKEFGVYLGSHFTPPEFLFFRIHVRDRDVKDLQYGGTGSPLRMFRSVLLF